MARSTLLCALVALTLGHVGCAKPASLPTPELVDDESTGAERLAAPQEGPMVMSAPVAIENAPRQPDPIAIEDAPLADETRISQLPDHPTRVDRVERARLTEAEQCDADVNCRARALSGATSAGGQLQLIDALTAGGDSASARRQAERFMRSFRNHPEATRILRQFDMLNQRARSPR